MMETIPVQELQVWCSGCGPMLGIWHHPHDREWILDQVSGLQSVIRADVLQEYSCCWFDAFNAETNPIKQEGVARRTANIWLREKLEEMGYEVTCSS
ncbi:MAG: hypothetical protein AB2697_19795 [Candidatus Thiodiazotropha endolucinida]